MAGRFNRRNQTDPSTVEQWKTLWTDPALRVEYLEWLSETLDKIAGRYARTPLEKRLQTACRGRFGVYDPGNPRQTPFIDEFVRSETAA